MTILDLNTLIKHVVASEELNIYLPYLFSAKTRFFLSKQFQRSRSIFQDGSRSLGLFWKKKSLKDRCCSLGLF